jgi:hypothetical protein
VSFESAPFKLTQVGIINTVGIYRSHEGQTIRLL